MIKNLNQLKRTLKENMLLEITGHCREECVGEIRRITKVNTQGFYSTVTSPSDRINPGKNPVLWWSKASFWQFQNGNCSVYTSLILTNTGLFFKKKYAKRFGYALTPSDVLQIKWQMEMSK